MSLAHEPARRVADSGAKAHQALGGGHERLCWPVENGYNGCNQLGVRFKRAPVAPTIFRPPSNGERTMPDAAHAKRRAKQGLFAESCSERRL